MRTLAESEFSLKKPKSSCYRSSSSSSSSSTHRTQVLVEPSPALSVEFFPPCYSITVSPPFTPLILILLATNNINNNNMLSLSLSPPNLSTAFLGNKLSVRGNTGKLTTFSYVPTCTRCAVDTPYGGGNVQKFPRTSVWDPYRRLGISRDASEEEIWGSRNFLLQQYAGHERSEESIEAAFEKLLMASFRQRKKTKINLKSRLKKKVEESPPWIKNLLNFVELPPTEVILRRLFLFAFMGGWSIMNSAETGPAFQVAISLAACIYFLNEKTKSLGRACIIGFGALVTGWVSGSLVVPNIPSMLLRPTWTLELLTSLFVYLFLFLACTFLK